MSKLKPCPFCGGKAHSYWHELTAWHHPDNSKQGVVKCVKCGLIINRETLREAITAWNCRTIDPTGDGSRAITFQGRISGDCECFCWDDVPLEKRREIVGERLHVADVRCGDLLDRLYPGAALIYLGVRGDRIYEFTISAKEIAVYTPKDKEE